MNLSYHLHLALLQGADYYLLSKTKLSPSSNSWFLIWGTKTIIHERMTKKCVSDEKTFWKGLYQSAFNVNRPEILIFLKSWEIFSLRRVSYSRVYHSQYVSQLCREKLSLPISFWIFCIWRKRRTLNEEASIRSAAEHRQNFLQKKFFPHALRRLKLRVNFLGRLITKILVLRKSPIRKNSKGACEGFKWPYRKNGLNGSQMKNLAKEETDRERNEKEFQNRI